MITYSREVYKILYRHDVNTWNIEESIPTSLIKYKTIGIQRTWFLEIRDSILNGEDYWSKAFFDIPEGAAATVFMVPRAFKYRNWVELGWVQMEEKRLISTLEKIFKLGAFL